MMPSTPQPRRTPRRAPAAAGWIARVQFTRAELDEFARWIDHAPARDLARHARRLASARRLNGISPAEYDALAKRLAHRRRQLGVASLTPESPDVPQSRH